MEICFIADDAFPWNLHFHCRIANQDGQIVGYWQPGVQNYPDEKRHRFVNTPHKNGVIYDIYADTYPVKTIKIRDLIDIKFDPEVPEKILSSKPLCMLYQVIDKKHLRMGFRASPKDKWYLSEIKDVSDIVKGEIKAFDEPCWGSTIGRHWGLPPGSPVYQKLLVDYVHYRYGLST
jgi:hypothetical protein